MRSFLIGPSSNLATLRNAFYEMEMSDPRLAAEIAYVLAIKLFQAGNKEESREFFKAAVDLFDCCPMESAQDCACYFTNLGGVCLPSSYIHQGVVRQRFFDLHGVPLLS